MYEDLTPSSSIRKIVDFTEQILRFTDYFDCRYVVFQIPEKYCKKDEVFIKTAQVVHCGLFTTVNICFLRLLLQEADNIYTQLEIKQEIIETDKRKAVKMMALYYPYRKWFEVLKPKQIPVINFSFIDRDMVACKE